MFFKAHSFLVNRPAVVRLEQGTCMHMSDTIVKIHAYTHRSSNDSDDDMVASAAE